MASKVERTLAAEVFRLTKAGSNVPNPVRAAARRVLQGNNSADDLTVIRSFLGVRRTGAGSLKRARGQIARLQGAFGDISRDVDIISTAEASGQGTAAAQGRLIGTLTREFERFTKVKFVKEASEGIVKRLGGDPKLAGNLLRSLRGAARIGGAVATVALLGVDLAERYFDEFKRSANALSDRKDLARRALLDPRVARAEEERTRELILADRNGIRALLDAVGFNAETEERITKAQAARLGTLQRARGNLDDLGISSDEILAAAAARKGKLISELTPRERAEALDAAAAGFVDPARFANDAQIQAQLNREFGGADQAFGQNLRDYSPFAFFGFVKTTEELLEARKQELMREKADQLLAKLEADKKVREAAADKLRRDRSPAEQIKHRVALEQSAAGWVGYRSRRQAWANR